MRHRPPGHRTVIVMKFGGTSLRSPDHIHRAVAAVAAARAREPLVVVSALATVTRDLVALSHDAATEPGPAVEASIDRLIDRHRAIADALGLASAARRQLDEHWHVTRESLRRATAEIRGDGQPTPRTEDTVLVHGERWSTALVTAALRAASFDAVALDAEAIVVTDDTHRCAVPQPEAINTRAAATIFPPIAAGRIGVLAGFIGATNDGAPTTMGFEASDLTAALIGNALGAEEIQIRTDVPGILSAAHRAVPAPYVVPHLSYREAAALARNGAKVLHPRTVEPARARAIPIRVLASADPRATGTVIGPAPAGTGTVKAMAIRRGLALVRLPKQTGAEVAAWVRDCGLDHPPPTLTATGDGASLLVVDAGPTAAPGWDDFGSRTAYEVETPISTITLVGDRLDHADDLLGRIAAAAGVPIRALGAVVSSTAVTVAVTERDEAAAVAGLHAALFPPVAAAQRATSGAA